MCITSNHKDQNHRKMTHLFNRKGSDERPSRADFFKWTSLITVFLLVMAGCDSSTDSGYDDNDNDDPPTELGPNDVGMVGTSFTPADLTVEVGTTVTWVNQSGMVHTVTSGTDGEHDGVFNSGDVNPGGEYSYTFNETGTYPYFCIPHVQENMTGVIEVVESGEGDEEDGDGDDGNGNGY